MARAQLARHAHPGEGIDAVILTHAHLDHCGWIPRLVKEGFRGPIYATPPTIDLCGIILPDSGHLQEEDARFYNKTKKSKHDPALPLYTFEEAQNSLQYFKPVRVGETSHSRRSSRFASFARRTFWGRAWPRCRSMTDGQTRRLLFTGDIGRVRDHKVAPGKVVHSGPAEGETADLLVMESTYGNRSHPKEDPLPELAALITATAKRGGSVVVPAFAIERTQKFVFILKHLIESGQIPRMPVFCDSPMAIKAVEIFLKHDEEYSDETRDMIQKYGSPLQWPGFTFASTPEESKKNQRGGHALSHHFFERHGDGRAHSASSGAAAARSQELWCCSSDFRRPERAGLQIKSKADEVKIFRGLCSHPRADRGAGAVQRSRRSAGTAAVAAHVSQPAGRDLSGSRGARRFGAVARSDEERVGMECGDRAVSGEGGSAVSAPVASEDTTACRVLRFAQDDKQLV